MIVRRASWIGLVAVAFASTGAAQDDGTPPVRIEFRVEGIAPDTAADVEAALARIEAVAEVSAGPGGTFRLDLARGRAADLVSIAEAIAGAASEQGPELLLDPGSLALSGNLRIEVRGVATAVETAMAASAIEATGAFRVRADRDPGTFRLEVVAPDPVPATVLVEAIETADPATPPRFRLGNVVWARD